MRGERLIIRIQKICSSDQGVVCDFAGKRYYASNLCGRNPLKNMKHNAVAKANKPTYF
jgi:hypothetical protein